MMIFIFILCFIFIIILYLLSRLDKKIKTILSSVSLICSSHFLESCCHREIARKGVLLAKKQSFRYKMLISELYRWWYIWTGEPFPSFPGLSL